MAAYRNQSGTVVIVLHEIYGINSHIRQVCKQLAKYGLDTIAPNLLKGRGPFAYDQEAAAYEYFMQRIGFEDAYEQVTGILQAARKDYKRVYVLGYSVGATLAWRCSATGLCDAVIGFYGSRIRDYLTILPQCPVLLLFPTQEKAFAVDDLILQVDSQENVNVIKLAGQHGFADAFSRSYNKKSAKQACKEILAFLNRNQFS